MSNPNIEQSNQSGGFMAQDDKQPSIIELIGINEQLRKELKGLKDWKSTQRPSFLTSAQAQASQWISVEDRLPEDKSIVLGYGKNSQCDGEKNIIVQIRVDHLRGHWADTSSSYPITITHWMPLPTPPRSEE